MTPWGLQWPLETRRVISLGVQITSAQQEKDKKKKYGGRVGRDMEREQRRRRGSAVDGYFDPGLFFRGSFPFRYPHAKDTIADSPNARRFAFASFAPLIHCVGVPRRGSFQHLFHTVLMSFGGGRHG